MEIVQRTQILDIILILILISSAIFQLLLPEILPVVSVISALASGSIFLLLYFQRLRRLETTESTPVSDTLVLLGGLIIGIYLLNHLIDLGTVPQPWVGFVVIVIGVFGRLFLLERLLVFIIDSIISAIEYIGTWLTTSIYNSIRVVSPLVGIALFILHYLEFIDLTPFTLLVISALFAFPFLITSFSDRQNQSPVIFRILVGIIGLGLLFIDLQQLSVASGMLILWSISIAGIQSFFIRFYQLFRKMAHWLYNVGTTVVQYISENLVWSFRLGSAISGIVVVGWSIFVRKLLIGVIGVLLFLPLLYPVLLRWGQKLVTFIQQLTLNIWSKMKEHPVDTVQIFGITSSLVIYFMISNLPYRLLISLSVLSLSLLPWLWRLVSKIWEPLTKLLKNTLSLIKKYPIHSLQIVFLIAAIPAYLFGPTNQIRGFTTRIVLSIAFVIAGIFPSVIRFGIQIWPTITSIGKWIWTSSISLLKNSTALPILIAIAGYSTMAISTFDRRLEWGIFLLSSLALIFAGDFWIIRFIDQFIFNLYRFVRFFLRIGIQILSLQSFGVFISFLSWITLFLSFSLWIFVNWQHEFWISVGLFLFSIVLWHSAYPKRRERFMNFLNSLIGGILKRLKALVTWTVKNLWIILLWVVGFGLMLIGVDLFIAGLFGLSNLIFGDLGNRLVEIIIALSLFGIGILTIQQSIQWREVLQVRGQKRRGDK